MSPREGTQPTQGRSVSRTGFLYDLSISQTAGKVKQMKKGEIVLPPDVNVWRHELATAKILAKNGYAVRFVKAKDTKGTKSFDIVIDGVEQWEIKSPRTSNLKAIERNLKRGRNQAQNVIIDSQRMNGVPDEAIEREVRMKVRRVKNLCHVKYINRRHEIIDIL